MSATLSPYTKKHALKPLVYALILASWAGQTQAQSVGSAPPSSRQDESQEDTDRATRLDTITVVRETRDEAGKADVFEKDVSNVYAGKEEIELYKGSSVGDLFKGLNGVYAGDSRNSGALDPNIRGIQGEGRIPLTIDGTEQATSVWLGPAGVANRNYVDPNMISSILVEKGVSATSGASGIGGSVQIRTLQVEDIVKPGESFGIELKAETATNSTKPNERSFGVFGKDYRDIPGAVFDKSGTNGVILPGSVSPERMPKEGNGGKNFNFEDHSYRLAIATKQENFDLLAAYSYRSRGNYYSGKKGSEKYEHDSWQEDAKNDKRPGFSSPSISYIAKYFRPGEEVLNTSSELETTLLKGTLRLPHDQAIDMSYMRSNHTFGESVPWNVVWAVHVLDGQGEKKILQNENPYSKVKQDTWNLNYSWNPEGNRFINLKAGAWITQSDSARHQNGDVIYGTQGDGWNGRDNAWDDYTDCHVLGRDLPMCANVPTTPPDKESNADGRFNIVPRALQITDHRRTGLNLSNEMTLHPTLDLSLQADFTREKLKQHDASENLTHLTELNWGVNHMGPRSGTRQQWNFGFNFDWRPIDWLQVNAGARYSDYWSYDDKLAEMRSQQHKDWAIRPALTGYNYHVKRLMTNQEVADYEGKIIETKLPIYKQYEEDWQFISDLDPSLLEAVFGHTTKQSFEDYLGKAFHEGKVNGYRYTDETVFVPSGDSHKDFVANNPFTNGEINASEKVTDAQGQKGTADKYIASNADRTPVYQDESEIPNKWEEPKKQKDHAWVPHIGLTAFITDDIRVYARYNEFVRFPSLFESSMAMTGSSKRSTGVAISPEHAYNWEIGYAHNLSSYFPSLDYADVRINYFNNRIKDYIDRDWDFNVVQFAEKKMSGIELQARVDSGKYFANFGGTYRLKQQLCDHDYARTFSPIPGAASGREVPGCMDGGFPRTFARTSLQPQYSLNLDVGARLLEKKLLLGARAVYHSAAKNKDEGAFGAIGWAYNRANYWNPILVFDAYASYQVQKNLNVDVAISNLTNQYYLDPMARTSIPAPGRTVRVGMTARF